MNIKAAKNRLVITPVEIVKQSKIISVKNSHGFAKVLSSGSERFNEGDIVVYDVRDSVHITPPNVYILDEEEVLGTVDE